eukprot:6640460-Pyramimonas_sp.AAC.1
MPPRPLLPVGAAARARGSARCAQREARSSAHLIEISPGRSRTPSERPRCPMYGLQSRRISETPELSRPDVGLARALS